MTPQERYEFNSWRYGKAVADEMKNHPTWHSIKYYTALVILFGAIAFGLDRLLAFIVGG